MKNWKTAGLAFLLSFSMFNSYAMTTLLINYEQLVKAIEVGNDVVAIVYFEKCQLTDPLLLTQFAQNLEGSSTRFNFIKYLHYKVRINGQLRDTVVTSIKSTVMHANSQKTTVYGRLNMLDDNRAFVHGDFYDSTNQKILLSIDWLCDISNGRDDNGLYLYNKN